MVFVRATVALATIAAAIPAPILLLALRSAAVVAFFFPSFAIFALLWGLLLFLGLLTFIPRLHFWCCLFRSACLFSSSLSPPVASIVCFSCWPPSLLVRVWLWGPARCSLMFGLTFLHLLICFAARCATTVFVSSLRFGSGLYDEAGFLGGGGGFPCGGVWVGILPLYPAGGPYIWVWSFFCGDGAVSPLLLLGVG